MRRWRMPEEYLLYLPMATDAQPREFAKSQVWAMSSNRVSPRHRTLTPGSPSPFRPKNPPHTKNGTKLDRLGKIAPVLIPAK